MKVVMQGRNNNHYAVGNYDTNDGSLTVYKGSRVSKKISQTKSFRGIYSVNKYRDMYVDNFVTTEDVKFKSPSTAANFISGGSTNGLLVWKTESGISLKKFLEENK